MKTHATQRSLKSLTDNGWTCHIVEKYIKHPGMPFGKRIDAYGIGDILACRPDTYAPCGQCDGDAAAGLGACTNCAGMGRLLVGHAAIALVQCFPDTGGGFAKHRDKINAIPELAIWKAAGGRVFLQGWAKKGPRGKVKRWTMREEEL